MLFIRVADGNVAAVQVELVQDGLRKADLHLREDKDNIRLKTHTKQHHTKVTRNLTEYRCEFEVVWEGWGGERRERGRAGWGRGEGRREWREKGGGSGGRREEGVEGEGRREWREKGGGSGGRRVREADEPELARPSSPASPVPATRSPELKEKTTERTQNMSWGLGSTNADGSQRPWGPEARSAT